MLCGEGTWIYTMTKRKKKKKKKKKLRYGFKKIWRNFVLLRVRELVKVKKRVEINKTIMRYYCFFLYK
jgi:hypothetical protein